MQTIRTLILYIFLAEIQRFSQNWNTFGTKANLKIKGNEMCIHYVL